MRLHLSLLLVALPLLSACAADQPMAINQSLDLSQAQLTHLRRETAAGRGQAAYQIALYYGFVRFDQGAERHWLEKSASLRWKPAMESLGSILVESPNEKERRRELLAQARKLPEV